MCIILFSCINCNLFQMKFTPDSYAFQIVLTQNYKDFCIWFHQNSHQLFSTVLQCFWQCLPTFERNMICTIIPTTLPHFSYTGFHIVLLYYHKNCNKSSYVCMMPKGPNQILCWAVGDELLTISSFKYCPGFIDLRGQTGVYLHQCRWLPVRH